MSKRVKISVYEEDGSVLFERELVATKVQLEEQCEYYCSACGFQLSGGYHDPQVCPDTSAKAVVRDHVLTLSVFVPTEDRILYGS